MSAHDAVAVSEPAPRRPRWRWWHWLIAALVAIPLAPILIWLIWLGIATLQWNSAIAEMRQAGMPATFAEYLAQLQPPEEAANAAPGYVAAAELVDADGQALKELSEWRLLAVQMTPEEREEWIELQRGVVREQPAALERVAQVDDLIPPAVERVRADFGIWQPLRRQMEAGDQPVMLQTLLPHLNLLRNLARVLSADAQVAAAEGDASRALLQVRRLLALGDALDDDGPVLVTHLVAVGIRGTATHAALAAAAALEEADRDAATIAIDRLLDESVTAEGFAHGLRSEAVMQQDLFSAVGAGRTDLDGGGTPSRVERLMVGAARPVLHGDAAQAAHLMRLWHEAADAPTRPTLMAQAPDVEEAVSYNLLDLFLSIYMPSLGRYAEAEYRSRAERRMAAVALAIALYRLDHAGQWPDALEELAPRYLPTVPRDPMAEGDAPIRYDPQRRILWSTGTDGIDDGGDPASTRRNGERQTIWDGRDAVVEL